jgi:Fic family protein
MVKHKQHERWQRIGAIIGQHPEGIGLQAIIDTLNHGFEAGTEYEAPPRRTLQFWLKKWVDAGNLRTTGTRRNVRYFVLGAATVAPEAKLVITNEEAFPFSKESLLCLHAVRKPLFQRKPVGYNYDFLNGYRPNVSAYLSRAEQAHLSQLGKGLADEPLPAGTFARQLLHRFLIDLSWNSSRLEGNTYSLLDTRRLIHFGAAADGKASLEAQMILNHKEAIEFLVGAAEDIGFNRYTVLNLHALLSDNLLENPRASGCLRQIAVGIGESVFYPLEVPQRIEACFEQTLATATAIHNPFEQALFALVQLPYLQAFDDVNKRVSRLAANIPLIKHNLIPLSFTDVPKDTYTDAILAVYELNRIEPLKDVFMWAYERSIEHYQAVRQTLGEPNAFRMRYRQELKTVVVEVVKLLLNKQHAYAHIKTWVRDAIPEADQREFQENTETELLGLHEGNFARYQLRPSEFEQWQKIWQDVNEGKL